MSPGPAPPSSLLSLSHPQPESTLPALPSSTSKPQPTVLSSSCVNLLSNTSQSTLPSASALASASCSILPSFIEANTLLTNFPTDLPPSAAQQKQLFSPTPTTSPTSLSIMNTITDASVSTPSGKAKMVDDVLLPTPVTRSNSNAFSEASTSQALIIAQPASQLSESTPDGTAGNSMKNTQLATPLNAPPLPQQSSPEEFDSHILNWLAKVGYYEYLISVNRPELLPRRLQKRPDSPAPVVPVAVARTSARGRVLKPTLRYTAATKTQTAKKASPKSQAAAPAVPALITRATSKKNSQSSTAVSTPPSIVSDSSAADTKKVIQPPARQSKRKAADVDSSASGSPSKKIKAIPIQPKKAAATKTAIQATVIAASPPAPHLAAAKTLVSVATAPNPTTDKAKTKKAGKKAGATGTGKAEKSRTKEQKWGDYLKNHVGNAKDAYQLLPGLAIPALGTKIDQVAVRPYAFNKGKVQEYGDGAGLHDREQELAREVGLSYDAYRQQKRMAFIGYAAMQLEGKKDFKKSHTQSMCNIDGNKSTHLWIHFHDSWGWMPTQPTPAITKAALGDLTLPELNAV